MPAVSKIVQCKRAIRAVLTNDMPLLKQLLTDTKGVPSVFLRRSVAVQENALGYAIKVGNMALFYGSPASLKWNAWNDPFILSPSPTQTNTLEVSAYLHPMQECIFWGQFMANPKIKCNLTVLLMLSLQSSDRNTVAFTVWRCLYWNKPNFDILYLVGCVCEC